MEGVENIENIPFHNPVQKLNLHITALAAVQTKFTEQATGNT